jgi:hypothetical protein
VEKEAAKVPVKLGATEVSILKLVSHLFSNPGRSGSVATGEPEAIRLTVQHVDQSAFANPRRPADNQGTW